MQHKRERGPSHVVRPIWRTHTGTQDRWLQDSKQENKRDQDEGEAVLTSGAMTATTAAASYTNELTHRADDSYRCCNKPASKTHETCASLQIDTAHSVPTSVCCSVTAALDQPNHLSSGSDAGPATANQGVHGGTLSERRSPLSLYGHPPSERMRDKRCSNNMP